MNSKKHLPIIQLINFFQIQIYTYYKNPKNQQHKLKQKQQNTNTIHFQKTKKYTKLNLSKSFIQHLIKTNS